MGGFGTSVDRFFWRDLTQLKNRDGVVNMYIGDRNLWPPFFGQHSLFGAVFVLAFRSSFE